MRPVLSSLVVAATLFAAGARAQQSTDSGTVTLQATVSGYMDIASGGPATLTGAQGGTISGNTNKGDQLSGMTISFGDVSPVNTNAFVRATVPLRLRSNIPYALSVSTSGFANADPLSIQATDIGFGIDAISRSDQGVNVAGVDNPVAAVLGDPAAAPDADPATPRWDFGPQKSLGDYTSARTVCTGERIMRVVPASTVGGLTLNTYFVIKPQFFTPGSFSTTVTYTITTP